MFDPEAAVAAPSVRTHLYPCAWWFYWSAEDTGAAVLAEWSVQYLNMSWCKQSRITNDCYLYPEDLWYEEWEQAWCSYSHDHGTWQSITLTYPELWTCCDVYYNVVLVVLITWHLHWLEQTQQVDQCHHAHLGVYRCTLQWRHGTDTDIDTDIHHTNNAVDSGHENMMMTTIYRNFTML